MTDHNDAPEDHENNRPRSDAPLWWSVGIFIVLAIAGMWLVDFYYSPDMISDRSLPEAVGK